MPIIVKDLSYTYMVGTPYEKKALFDISLNIVEGDYVGIIGTTGSGKSTFIKHLNALIKLQKGTIIVDEIDLTKKKPDLKLLRKKVGIVFQYPESQLFADTVLKDIEYGPKNANLSKEECTKIAKESMELVGLDFESFKDRSPFEISGGEKRRVAIAGVLACNPKYLIMDEPSAGLDPKGKEDIYELIKNIKQNKKTTIIVISHDIDEIAEYTNRVVAFKEGKIFADFKTEDIYENYDVLIENGLDVPLTIELRKRMSNKGIEVKGVKLSEFTDSIIRQVFDREGNKV